MKLVAIKDKVILTLKPRQEQSDGGIVIPDRAQEASTEGIVVSVGTEVELPVSVGDTVGVARTAGTVARVGGKEVLFVPAHKLLYVR